MNNRGIKDQVFTCKGCGTEFAFKGYNRNHIYCSRHCASNHKAEVKEAEAREAFNEGELSSRKRIFKFLVERDGNKCSVCNIVEWNGKPIRFWVDHIDGDASNNAPDNFRLVCPNCDSQSETFGAKNWGNGRKAKGLPQYG